MARVALVILVILIQSRISYSNQNMEPQKACRCGLYSTCTWSKHMINQITVLEETNPIRQILSQQFTLQVCDFAQRHVWCCRNGERATDSELKQLDRNDILPSGKQIYLPKNTFYKSDLTK